MHRDSSLISREIGTSSHPAAIIIAIGGNLSDDSGRSPLATCRAATVALGGLAQCRLHAISRWYRSPAWPPSDQPDYINGAALLIGRIAPARLLADLHAIEAHAGRRRGVANAARTLDLDIIAIGGLVRPAPDPVLPHPQAHLRRFVLQPIADIMPDWRHPASGETVRALLAGLPGDALVPL